MYFFLVLVVIILVTVNYYVSEYKKRAISAGEADLSLTEKNILPFCRTCKICAGTSFILMLVSGIMLILVPALTGNSNWSFLIFDKGKWINVHLFLVVVFFLSFGFHTYIHWNWFKAALSRKRIKPI
ncbi:MAG: DUF4405 domain-containing protein [Ignavibacteria bacterium]|nr:DUF4405 domain-containing protein [Ignavibacteria bacterium]MCC7159574.1 DUF4405 domain-containing protein [Ignavibacteria bacterium]